MKRADLCETQPVRMVRRDTSHVVVDAGDCVCRCNNCGATDPLQLPISVPDFVTSAQRFIDAHADCAKTALPGFTIRCDPALAPGEWGVEVTRPSRPFVQQYLQRPAPTVDPFVATVPARSGDDPRFPGRRMGETRWLCRVCNHWHTPMRCVCATDDVREAVFLLRARIAELEAGAK